MIDLKNNRNVPNLLLLLGVFLVSRSLYDRAGIPFLGDTYQYYWQFIHPSLLKDDLWRSILYLNNQPPLMNILTGLVLQSFPGHAQQAFHLLYGFAGAALTVSIYFLGIQLGFRGWMSFIITALFAISPSTIIYEHLLMYGYLIAAALTLSGVALYRFAESRSAGWGLLFFSLLAVVALLWTLFHIVWMLVVCVVLLFSLQDRRNVLRAALVPLLVVSGWYAKNLVLFGEFTAGTWSGMNLAHMTTFRLPEKERQEMVTSGALSAFAAYPPFRNPVVYLRLLPDTPTTGIPVLDVAEFPGGVLNMHHLTYVEASNFYLRDALQVIRIKPALYLRSVVQSLYIYFHSSSDFELIWEIRLPIRAFDVTWSRLFYGQWLSEESPAARLEELSPLHVAWWIIVAFVLGILGNSIYLWRNPWLLRTPGGLLILFMMFNVLYVTVIGNAMDLGENNRFRYVIDPFILMLAVHGVYRYVLSRRMKEIPSSSG